ncbi:MAG: NADH-quinone oxidoreductase subunit NuoE, partial [Chloroflexi bacterium]|nr:NADH-quinone oxidoreductase subunit NuoE [Chloroflexota bacterium]
METPVNGPADLLVMLQQAQRKHGCISGELMAEIAASLDIPSNDVYGVATFYSFLSTRPLGRNVIRVCKSLPCYIRNGHRVVDTISRELGIRPGETTPDRRFTLLLANCMGLCDEPPAMMINDDAHGGLTPEKILNILA